MYWTLLRSDRSPSERAVSRETAQHRQPQQALSVGLLFWGLLRAHAHFSIPGIHPVLKRLIPGTSRFPAAPQPDNLIHPEYRRTKQRQVVLPIVGPMEIPAARTGQTRFRSGYHTQVCPHPPYSFGPPAVDEPCSTVTTGKRPCVHAPPLFLIPRSACRRMPPQSMSTK